MTTPDSGTPAAGDFAAGLWQSCGPLFTVVRSKDGTRANLLYRGVIMATASGSGMKIYVTADTGKYNCDGTEESIRHYVDSVSHLDVILRKWPEVRDDGAGSFSLLANGTVYARVSLSLGGCGYMLIPGNRRAPQHTGSLEDLSRYTDWLVQALDTRETSHTVLFIDSMRRL